MTYSSSNSDHLVEGHSGEADSTDFHPVVTFTQLVDCQAILLSLGTILLPREVLDSHDSPYNSGFW